MDTAIQIRDGSPEREKCCAFLQTVVPPSVAEWVSEQARADGVSVSHYLRRLISREMHGKKGTSKV